MYEGRNCILLACKMIALTELAFFPCFHSQSNDLEKPNFFDRKPIIRQIRALQILETVNLMACGLPHRMRFRAFNSRFRCIGPFRCFKKSEDKAIDECKVGLMNINQKIQKVITDFGDQNVS